MQKLYFFATKDPLTADLFRFIFALNKLDEQLEEKKKQQQKLTIRLEKKMIMFKTDVNNFYNYDRHSSNNNKINFECTSTKIVQVFD
jgi:hypothetical protein